MLGAFDPAVRGRPSVGGRMSLCERVVARTSPVHGRGVFALRRFREGQYIGTFEGSPTTKDGTYVLWVIEDDGSETGIRGENDLRFLNHSRRPNAELRADDLHALRNIQPGAEICIHYGEGWHHVE